IYFFFFQAEDGIRDFHVTGVQTCALPILLLVINTGSTSTKLAVYRDAEQIHTTSLHHSTEDLAPFATIVEQKGFRQQVIVEWLRSEERRVGKEGRCGWSWARKERASKGSE